MALPQGYTTLQVAIPTKERFNRNKKAEQENPVIGNETDRFLRTEDFQTRLLDMYEALRAQEKK